MSKPPPKAVLPSAGPALKDTPPSKRRSIASAPQVDSSDQGIKVLCRFRRPMTVINKSGGNISNSVEADVDGFPTEQNSNGLIALNDSYTIDVTNNKVTVNIEDNERRSFSFDRLLSPFVTQREVFEEVHSIVDAVCSGFNGTIMAYGQTSAGKSYTMDGPSLFDPDLQGVTSRAIEKLFVILGNLDADTSFEMTASYMEIYCEKVRDLLNPSSDNLKLREKFTSSGGSSTSLVVVQDLTESVCTTKESLYKLLEKGKTNRMIAPTLSNAESSRSHSIFTINISIKGKTARQGKLYLVDLAGSEKISKTGASGARLEEAKTINSSLTTLSMVIQALCDNSTGHGSNFHTGTSHVPYRDSKLTYFLRDALGGNSKTVLILCCAPERDHVPETVSTLRFGERAKRIKNKATVNEEVSVDELKSLVARLKDENKKLKFEMERMGSSSTSSLESSKQVTEKASDTADTIENQTSLTLSTGSEYEKLQNMEGIISSHNNEKYEELAEKGSTATPLATKAAYNDAKADDSELTTIDSVEVVVEYADQYWGDLEAESKIVGDNRFFGEGSGEGSDASSSIKELTLRIANLGEEVGRLHGVVGMKDDELEEERTRSDQDRKKTLELHIENEVLRGAVKDLEEKLIHQISLNNREDRNSIDKPQASRSRSMNNSIDFLVSINSTLATLEINTNNNSDMPDSDYVVKLKQEYNDQLTRLMGRLDKEQQARVQLSERLEEADQHISNLRGRLQSAEDNALLRESSSSNSISWFSYVGRKIENAGRKSSSRGPYISPREELLAKSLADSQTRCIELESELSTMKEAHAIVMETKDSVLRNFISQNSLLTLEKDKYKSMSESLNTRVNQLTGLLRDIDLLKQSNCE